jgi:DNA/RNA endonuclease YhcR with UshA esterase domain
MEQEKNKVDPSETRYHQETHCQSCGRFVGVFTRCPYCQALTQKRMSIRVFKVLSVLVSTVGLLLLLFYARNVKTPETKISDLGPLSNFAHVRIKGIVTQSYGIHEKWGSLGFVVSEGANDNPITIRVSAYSKVAKAIADADKIPKKGDYIYVEGQVRFQKDTASLLLNAPEHIEFIEKAIDEPEIVSFVELDSINSSVSGKLVRTTGNINAKQSFPTGMLLTLDDGSANGFKVGRAKNLWDERQNPEVGDLVEITGKVASFKGEIQINLLKKGDLKVAKRVAPENKQ